MAPWFIFSLKYQPIKSNASGKHRLHEMHSFIICHERKHCNILHNIYLITRDWSAGPHSYSYHLSKWCLHMLWCISIIMNRRKFEFPIDEYMLHVFSMHNFVFLFDLVEQKLSLVGRLYPPVNLQHIEGSFQMEYKRCGSSNHFPGGL